MADEDIFRVMVCGLSDRDRMLVSSAARISSIRSNKYEIFDASKDDAEAPPEIYLVDDTPPGWVLWTEHAEACDNRQAPVLVLGDGTEHEQPPAPRHQFFKRPLVATRLLKALDEMALNFFQHGVAISDNVSLSEITAIAGEARAVSANSKRVLVVDDSESVRKLMSVKLNAKGVNTDFAEDGETALSMARNNRYDLIFLDVMLPGIDGYEVCRHMKKNLGVKAKILMLTSRSSRMDRLRGSLSTADGYLVKPLSGEDLREVLAEYLEIKA